VVPFVRAGVDSIRQGGRRGIVKENVKGGGGVDK